MSRKLFTTNETVSEGADAEYECVFYDAGGDQLNKAAIQTIVATLSDAATGTVLNSRTSQNVKDANGGTLATDGTFTLELTASDNVIQTPSTARPYEQHRLTLEVTYTKASGTGNLVHEVLFYVRNLSDV